MAIVKTVWKVALAYENLLEMARGLFDRKRLRYHRLVVKESLINTV